MSRKLLAAVAVFAMVAAAFAVVSVIDESAAETDAYADYYDLPGGPLNFSTDTQADSGSGDTKYNNNYTISNKILGNKLTVEWNKDTMTYTVSGDLVLYKAVSAAPTPKANENQPFQDLLFDVGVKTADSGLVVFSAPAVINHNLAGAEVFNPSSTGGHFIYDISKGNETKSFQVKLGESQTPITIKFNVKLAETAIETPVENAEFVLNQETAFAFSQSDIINSGFGTAGSWSLTDNLLTLNGYQGNNVFQGDFQNIAVKGDVRIDVDSNKLLWKDKLGNGGINNAVLVSVIGSTNSNAMNVTLDDGASLTINIAGTAGHGITKNGNTLAFTSEGKATVEINGGNRAISGGTALNFTNITGTFTGAERGISGSMNIEITTSDITAKATGAGNNDLGVNDYWGIKTAGSITVNKGSKLTANGILVGTAITNNGTLIVNDRPNSANTNAFYTDAAGEQLFSGKNAAVMYGDGWNASISGGNTVVLNLYGQNIDQYFYLKTSMTFTVNVTDNAKIAASVSKLPLLGIRGTLNLDITEGKKLTLCQGDETGYGLYASTVDIDSTTTGKAYLESLTGNRAIYGPTSIAIDNVNVDVAASEKAIRGGDVTITDSNVNAKIISGPTNNQGDDDLFGIKGKTLTFNATSKDSVINSDGIRGESLVLDKTKSLVINITEYKQNPAAKMYPVIAGLFLNDATDLTIGLSTDKKDVSIYDVSQVYAPGAEISGQAAKDTVQEISGGTEGVVDEVAVESSAEVPNVTVDMNGVSPEADTKTITKLTPAATTQDIVITGVGSTNTLKITEPVPMKETQTLSFTGDAKSVEVTVEFKDSTGATTSKVEVKLSGAFTIAKGSIVLGGTGVAGEVTIDANEVLKLDSTFVSSNASDAGLKIKAGANSKIIFVDNIDVPAGKFLEIDASGVDAADMPTVNIPQGVEVTLGAAANLNFKNVKVQIGGNILGQEAAINADATTKVYFEQGAIFTPTLSGEGSYSTADAILGFDIDADITSNIETNNQQKVTILNSIKIIKGASLTIHGQLVVPEGTTIIIQDGGKLVVDGVTSVADVLGEIVIEGTGSADAFTFSGKELNVDGKISVDGKKMSVTAGTTTVKGEILIADNASASFTNGVAVKEGGVLAIKGSISGNVDSNAGLVTINGTADFTVKNVKGGVVEIISINGTVTVTDLGMKMAKSGNNTVDDDYKLANKVIASNVKGLKVITDVSSFTMGGSKVYTNQMFIEGSVSKAFDLPSVTLYGDIDLASDVTMTIGKNVKVNVQTPADVSVHDSFSGFNVDGTIDATADGVKFTAVSAAAVTVNGTIKTVSGASSALAGFEKVNAVMYTFKVDMVEYDIYTNLAAALASGESELKVLGNLNIFVDTVIPAGVVIDATGKTVNVGSAKAADATLTVQDGASFKAATVNVVGSFVIENTDNVTCPNIISDVSSVNGKNAIYTNIYNALANAKAGDEVKVTNKDGTVVLKKDITIPAGVTLQVPTLKELRVVNGVTMTIDGTLFLNNGELKAVADPNSSDSTGKFGLVAKNDANKSQDSVLVVNGTIESMGSLKYDDYKVAGAYYDANAKSIITTIENAAANISKADLDTIKIYGANKVGEVAFVGTSSEPVTVQVKLFTDSEGTVGKLTADKISVDNGTIVFDNGVVVSGVLAGAAGNVTVKDVAVSGSLEIKSGTSTTVTGAIAGEAGSSVVFDGKVDIKGTFNVTAEKITVAETAEVTSKNPKSGSTVLNLKGTATDAADVLVNGVLQALNGGTIDVDGVLTVYGTITASVEDAVAKTTKGVFNADNLYVGISVKDVDSPYVSGAAAVNGNIKVVGLVYVYNGCTVDSKMLETAKSVEFIVEDNPWITVYKTADSTFTGTFAVDNPPVKNAKFENKWVDAKKSPLTLNADLFDQSPVKAFAKIKYDIYKVQVVADEGIGTVAIDGSVLKNEGGNIFSPVADLKAGDHTVTFKFKEGYEGKVTMSSNSDKVAVSGLTFTLSGSANSTPYSLNLQGAEPMPPVEPIVPPTPVPPTPVEPVQPVEPADDGLTVTDYLLIVLVVLIAIMAVMVALKLMRS